MKHLSAGPSVGHRMAARQLSRCLVTRLCPAGVIVSARLAARHLAGTPAAAGAYRVIDFCSSSWECCSLLRTMHVAIVASQDRENLIMTG